MLIRAVSAVFFSLENKEGVKVGFTIESSTTLGDIAFKSALLGCFAKISRKVSIFSEPKGAEIYR